MQHGEGEGPTDVIPSPVAAVRHPDPAPRRRRATGDVVVLAIVGMLLVAAVAATVSVLYRELYSPSAFVQRYLSLLSDGRAAEALTLPGVVVDAADLEAAGLPAGASEALLRRAALAALSDVEIVAETPGEDGSVQVTATYSAGSVSGTTTFSIAPDGWIGVAPTWRFSQSPLAVMDLVVQGSMSFEVNGFELDKRQVSPEGGDADPLAPLSLLVFSPGIYAVSVDSAMSATPGVAVLSDSPFASVAVDVQAEPTDEFIEVVQSRVDEFLDTCATQEVLQPTACPFGFVVRERLASTPVWSIVEQPVVTLEPDGAGWRIPPTTATAHIDVKIRSLFDGSVRTVQEDVPFVMTGTISVLPDGTATITVGGAEG